MCSKVEHPFRVIKRQFDYRKVRFKGVAKNTAQIVTLFALSNVWVMRRTSLTPVAGSVSVIRGNTPTRRQRRLREATKCAIWGRSDYPLR